MQGNPTLALSRACSRKSRQKAAKKRPDVSVWPRLAALFKNFLLVVAGQAGRAAVVAVVVAQERGVLCMWIMAGCALNQWLTIQSSTDTVVQRQVVLALAAGTVSLEVPYCCTAGYSCRQGSMEVRIVSCTGRCTCVLDADRVIVPQVGAQVDHLAGNLAHVVELAEATASTIGCCAITGAGSSRADVGRGVAVIVHVAGGAGTW